MATELQKEPKRGRGRPPAFNRSAALYQALKLFWDQGYEGTSFDDLTAAMGLSPSSFYNSFGSKECLYREATEAYLAASGEWFLGALTATTDTRTAFAALLTAAADSFTQNERPRGCMISLAGTHVRPALMQLRDMMAGYRQAAERAMADRIRKGIDAGDVPTNTNVEALAAFYSACSRGMAVQARDGASRKRLQEIVDIAMGAWPTRCLTHVTSFASDRHLFTVQPDPEQPSEIIVRAATNKRII